MDLFEPGQGPEGQVHDFTPGLYPNGLFWTAQVPAGTFTPRAAVRGAELEVHGMPLADSFQFAAPFGVASQIDIDVDWVATDRREHQSHPGDPPNPDGVQKNAFEADFAPARCTGRVEGHQLGFAFRSGVLTSDAFYAELGTERNGAFI